MIERDLTSERRGMGETGKRPSRGTSRPTLKQNLIGPDRQAAAHDRRYTGPSGAHAKRKAPVSGPPLIRLCRPSRPYTYASDMVSRKGAMALAKRLERYWHDRGYPAARFWAEPIDERFDKVGSYEIYRVVCNLVNGLPPRLIEDPLRPEKGEKPAQDE